MTSFARKLAFSTVASCLALMLGSSPAFAAHKHHAKSYHVHHRSNTTTQKVVRIAQEHLSNLGYYTGKIDGIMGAQTRSAIKHFQHDQKLKVDGVLGPKTNAALENADHRVIGTEAIPFHEIPTSIDPSTINPNYVASPNSGTQTISSRYARVDVSVNGSDAERRYDVNVNGQSILTVNGQPSVIGISPAYDLGNEDAVVLTTFSPNDTLCTYKNHVLLLNGAGNTLLDIQNCTREYQARVNNGDLYISFPEREDNRAIGATWRVEGTTLERL